MRRGEHILYIPEASWVDGVEVSAGQWGDGIWGWSSLLPLTFLALAGSTLLGVDFPGVSQLGSGRSHQQ